MWILLPIVAAWDHLGKCSGEQQEVQDCVLKDCPEHACIDCIWGGWSEWSPCTCEGLRDHHRTMKQTNNFCGTPCTGNRVETEKCIPECIKNPIDCVLDEWGPWSQCDKTCGSGQQTRERGILKEQQYGGEVCNGDLKEVQACAEYTCEHKVDCELSGWEEWSVCSQSCGGGQRERSRSIVQESQDLGAPCDAVVREVEGCNEQPCAGMIDCVWGNWVEWGACSVTCGGGNRSRSRLIKVAPRAGGKLCDPLDMSEVGACNMQPCEAVIDCEFAEWTEWDACSCSCNGIRARSRHITRFPEEGGKSCVGALKELEPCNVKNCHVTVKETPAIDCILSEWQAWSACSHTCGHGIRTRDRAIAQAPMHNGKPCDDVLREVEGCAPESCPVHEVVHEKVDCIWSDWDDWGACSASCGGGQKQRQRQVKQMGNKYGHGCTAQASTEVAACNTEGCECHDCTWGPWSNWGACTCTGIQEKHRSIETHYNSCGIPCEGPKVTTRSCRPDCQKDPVHCEFSEWTPWGECSAECGGGEQERTREIVQDAQFGGDVCQGDLRELRPCNEVVCHTKVDCVLGNWQAWSKCSQSCGGGQRYRNRQIQIHPAAGGKPCSDVLSEVEGCGEEACGEAIDCLWGQWSGFSACSVSCGGGYKSRDRSVKVAPRNGGKLCDPLSKAEVVECNTVDCPSGCKDALWDEWTEWGLCSASCGTGYRSRSRVIARSGNECGSGIDGPMQEFEQCQNTPCEKNNIDCQFGGWSEWGDCSCSCDGIRDRTRQIAVYSQGGGAGCEGPMKQVEPCNTGVCEGTPVDCELGSWNDWEPCSVECGGGSKIRRREIIQEPKFGGEGCDASIKEVSECNMHPCHMAQNCKWGEWNEWGACSQECGGGQRNRYRHIMLMPKNGGFACNKHDSVEIEACNAQPCGTLQYCGWGPWADWTSCSVSCGRGEQSRQRSLVVSNNEVDEVLSSGILEQMHSQLNELQGKFSFEHLIIVYVFGALSTALLLTAGVYFVRRRSTFHQVPQDGHLELMERLTPDNAAAE